MAIHSLGGCVDGPIEVLRRRLGASNIDRKWPEPHHPLVQVIAKAPEVSRSIAA